MPFSRVMSSNFTRPATFWSNIEPAGAKATSSNSVLGSWPFLKSATSNPFTSMANCQFW